MDWQTEIMEEWQAKIMEEARKLMRENVLKAKDDAIKSLEKMWASGKKHDGSLSAYSEKRKKFYPTHKERREAEGLRTAPKDFKFSGTLIKSLKETKRVDLPDRFEVTLAFTGKAHRRPDQKPGHKYEPLSNQDVAKFLGMQEKTNIILLPPDEKDRIQRTYGVRIYDKSDS